MKDLVDKPKLLDFLKLTSENLEEKSVISKMKIMIKKYRG